MPKQSTPRFSKRHFPRAVRTLSDELERRTNAYLLAATSAGIALLAAPQPAKANTIVYQQVNQSFAHEASFSLGSATFSFSSHSSYAPYDVPWNGRASGADAAFFGNYIPPRPGVKIPAQYGPFGTELGPFASVYLGAALGLPGATSFGYRGSFFHGDHFLGLQFDLHGKIHYGWVDLGISPHTNPGQLPLLDLISIAYNRVPNAPIVIGQTSNQSVPEPSTLALLALGAVGLPFWRKKAAKSRNA